MLYFPFYNIWPARRIAYNILWALQPSEITSRCSLLKSCINGAHIKIRCYICHALRVTEEHISTDRHVTDWPLPTGMHALKLAARLDCLYAVNSDVYNWYNKHRQLHPLQTYVTLFQVQVQAIFERVRVPSL